MANLSMLLFESCTVYHSTVHFILSSLRYCPCRVGTSVRIVKVLPPAPPTSPSIIQPPTPSVDQLATKTGPETVTQNGEASNCEIIDVVSNGISEVTPTPSDATLKPVTPSVKPVFKIPKTPRTPLIPLTPEILLNADDYRYVVKDEANPEKIREVEAAELSRPKGLFTSAKLKLLLRSVLVRKSDKHPFTVKVSSFSIILMVYWVMYVAQLQPFPGLFLQNP